MKRAGEPIVMVTAYDFPSAQVAEEAGVDLVLVGDTAAMTVLGYDSTVPVTMDEMVMLASAVRRGARTSLVIGDLPFGSYQGSNELAVTSAVRYLKEAGCDAVKLEMAGFPGAWPTSASPWRARVDRRRRDPGDGPRRPDAAERSALGGYRTQGRTDAAGRPGRRRRALASGCGLLRNRVRGGSRGGHGGDHGAHARAGDRHRRRCLHRRAGAGVPRLLGLYEGQRPAS